MSHVTRLFKSCRNKRSLSQLVVFWAQITVWKKMPSQRTKMMNSSLSVQIIGLVYRRVRRHKSTPSWEQRWTNHNENKDITYLLTAKKSGNVNGESDNALWYPPRERQAPQQLSHNSLHACEIMTNCSIKRHWTVMKNCPGKMPCTLRFKHWSKRSVEKVSAGTPTAYQCTLNSFWVLNEINKAY